MRYIQPDGTGKDLGMVDLSQDMYAVLQDLQAAGISPSVETVRTLRQHFHVRFDVHAHRVRLDTLRSRLASLGRSILVSRANGIESARLESISDGHISVRHYLLDEVIATERASLKRVRARAGPTGQPNIGSKAARAAARIAKRARERDHATCSTC